MAWGERRISAFSNFIIALLSASLTFVAMMFGKWIEQILPVQVANDLGAVVIIGVGISITFESAAERILFLIRSWIVRFFAPLTKLFSQLTQTKQKTYTPQTIPRTTIPLRTLRHKSSRFIDLKETLILGVSLALNAMAGGNGSQPI